MKKISLFLVGFTFLVFGCSEEDPQPRAEGLVGAWNLTELEYEGSSTTIASGFTITSDFTGAGKDMNLTVTFNENPNTVTSEGSYTIELTTTVLGQSFTEDVNYDNFFSDGTWAVNNNTLTVTSGSTVQEASITSQSSTKLVLEIITEETLEIDEETSITTSIRGSFTLERN